MLASDTTGASYQFQIKNADVGAGQIVTMTADLDSSQLVFNNAQADGGMYNLEIECVSTSGVKLFAHTDIDISATDTHYANYNGSNCSGAVTLNIDHGSNGTIDEVLTLRNQAKESTQVNLPIILK